MNDFLNCFEYTCTFLIVTHPEALKTKSGEASKDLEDLVNGGGKQKESDGGYI